MFYFSHFRTFCLSNALCVCVCILGVSVRGRKRKREGEREWEGNRLQVQVSVLAVLLVSSHRCTIRWFVFVTVRVMTDK